MTKEEVVSIAREMSADDRAWIVASIDPADDEDAVPDATRAELERRIDQIDSGQMHMLSRDEFRARVAELRTNG